MTELFEEYHLLGLAIGVATFLIIGMFHPIVIKVEYHWGTRPWWIFLTIGIGGICASIAVENVFWSSLLGVFSFSSFWTIKELFDQRKRVERGWFPRNPKRESRDIARQTTEVLD